jgi:hypothetical protein
MTAVMNPATNLRVSITREFLNQLSNSTLFNIFTLFTDVYINILKCVI